LITTETNIPPGDYLDVIRVPGKRYELQCGFAFATIAERLYKEGKIAFAYTYNCSGFALRRLPFLHLFGGSFLKNWVEYYKFTPWWKRAKLIPGFLHYVVPEAITARKAYKVLAKVEDLRQDLIKYYGLAGEAIDVIPNGVGNDFLSLYQMKDFSAPPAIAFTGRLHMDKGIVPFTEAFVRHREIDAPLMVVGDGPQMPDMVSLAKCDSRIKLLGKRDADQIKQLLSWTNIFVFPGIIGGYSCSLLEGMASGHACVCYDIKGNREAISDAGLVAPFHDPDAMCERISTLLHHRELISRYASLAHERAKAFRWEAFADKLSHAFEEMYQLSVVH